MKKSTTILILFYLLFYNNYSFSQCSTPTNLQSTMVGASATFTWDAVPSAVSYTIDFKYTAYGWDNIEYSETITTNSLVLNDIMQSIDLNWRVSANCGLAGNSGFTEANFSTPCALPTQLTTSNITTNSATLNWVAPAALGSNTGAYVYAYRPAGVNASWIPLGNSTNLNFNLNGLTPGVTYEWCVNQICAYYTGAPAISTFTTQPLPCGIASLWLPNQITTTQANLRWNTVPNAIDYIVEYKPSNSQNWTTTNSTTLNKLIQNLSPATQYDWRVRAICPSNNIGAYSGIGQFSTAAVVVVVPPVNCTTVPNGLSINNLGNRSATFNWSAAPNATSYTLHYKLATNAGWLAVNGITGTSFTRTNLQIGGNYIFKVRAVCTSGSSAFSPDFTFSTLNCVSAGNNISEWIDFFSLGTINRVSGAEAGGYVNTGLSTNLNIGSTGNQGQISAGFAGASRTQNYSVYIDFNRNGNYNDAGERVFGIGGLSNANIFNFNINVPSTATPGSAGLRVVMSKNGQPTNGPCLENFEGETEDYLVNLIAATSRISAENESITIENPETISVFPNPSSGIFKVNIPSNFEAENVIVYDILGKKIITQAIGNEAEIEVNLQNEVSGMYLLNIQNKKGQKISRKLWKY